MSGLETSVKAKSGAFGNYIDPQRELFDAPQLSLVRAERVLLRHWQLNGSEFVS